MAAALATIVVVVGGCSSPDTQACGDVVTEEFDTQSSLHVPEGTEVQYLTWPPTSGPHISGEAPTGALARPLSGPLQVTALEGGKVVIQYQGISDADVERLNDLAGENVVVAPGAELPAAVVTTAWTTKQACAGVDLGTHREFIEVYGQA